MYYANGSYYDPKTGLYVDASPIDTVIDNALTTTSLDRNGLLCNNVLELAGNPYTIFNDTDLSTDSSYEPKLNWFQRMVKTLADWWKNISVSSKVVVGTVLVVASVVAAYYTGGASLGAEAELLSSVMATSALATVAKTALIDISVGIGFGVANWALTSALTGTWNTGTLSNSIAESIFFTGVFMFISASINALKYVCRSDPYPMPEIVNKNPLEELKYTGKVQRQMLLKDNHGFPLIVDNYGTYGTISVIKGGDKSKYIRVAIKGTYKKADGIFEYIYDINKLCNHREFIRFK